MNHHLRRGVGAESACVIIMHETGVWSRQPGRGSQCACVCACVRVTKKCNKSEAGNIVKLSEQILYTSDKKTRLTSSDKGWIIIDQTCHRYKNYCTIE